MTDIGIRELKSHASAILRKVKETGARYIITHRGRPIAAIIPLEKPQDIAIEGNTTAWDDLIMIGEQISQSWQSEQDSTEILSGMRR